MKTLYTFLFTCLFAAASSTLHFAISPFMNDFNVYSFREGIEAEWEPFTNGDFATLVKRSHEVEVLSRFMHITPDDVREIEDRLVLGDPKKIVTIADLEDAIRVFSIDAPRYLKRMFPMIEGFATCDNCIHLGALNERYREVQEILSNQKYNFDNYFFDGEQIDFPIIEPNVIEGNCFTYMVARLFGYEGDNIVGFVTSNFDNISQRTLVTQSSFIPFEELQDGDWVRYPGDPEGDPFQLHFGIIRNRNGVLVVESKWGGDYGPVRRHRIDEIPSTYGSIVCFYRLKPNI